MPYVTTTQGVMYLTPSHAALLEVAEGDSSTTARQQVSVGRGTIYEEGTYPLVDTDGTTAIGTTGKTSRVRQRITAHGTADYRLWYGNFTRGGLTGGPNDIIVGATVEDPGTGDAIPVTFNGADTIRIAPFGLVGSDPFSLTEVPDFGDMVWVWTFVKTDADDDEVPGGATTGTALAQRDYVDDQRNAFDATQDNLDPHRIYGPCAMTAAHATDEQVAVGIGDSNMWGQGDDIDSTAPDYIGGFLERACDSLEMPCVMLASPGTGQESWVNDPTPFWTMATQFGGTVAVIALGTNDIGNNPTAQEMIDRQDVLIDLAIARGMLPVVCTIPPFLDPGDSFVASQLTLDFWDATRSLADDDRGIYVADNASAVQAAESGDPDLTGLYWGTDDSDNVYGTDLHYTQYGHAAAATILAQAITARIADPDGGGLVQATARFTPAAPVNTSAPAITGSANAGSTLTYAAGSWTGFPVPTITHQWRKDGVAISGETGSTYATADPGDIDGVIDVLETATNTQGSASEDSNDITVVDAPDVFDPDTITGTERWVASDLADGAVASWTSTQSATALAQGTSGSRPVKGTADAEPAVSFDGDDDNLSTALTLTQPFDVWMVLEVPHAGRNPLTNQDEALWAVDGSAFAGAWWNGLDGTLKLSLGADLVSSAVTLNDGYHVIRFLANGGSSKIDLDGVTIASGDAGSSGGTNFRLGASLSGGFEGNIDVPELDLKKTGAYTTQELSDLLGYAQATYSTP